MKILNWNIVSFRSIIKKNNINYYINFNNSILDNYYSVLYSKRNIISKIILNIIYNVIMYIYVLCIFIY